MTQRLHERRNAAAATTDAATASSHNNHHGHPHNHAHAHHHQSHHSAAAHGRHDMQADHPSPAVFTPPAFSDHHAANHADRGWGNFGGPHLRSHGLTPGASGHHETSNLLSIPGFAGPLSTNSELELIQQISPFDASFAQVLTDDGDRASRRSRRSKENGAAASPGVIHITPASPRPRSGRVRMEAHEPEQAADASSHETDDEPSAGPRRRHSERNGRRQSPFTISTAPEQQLSARIITEADMEHSSNAAHPRRSARIAASPGLLLSTFQITEVITPSVLSRVALNTPFLNEVHSGMLDLDNMPHEPITASIVHTTTPAQRVIELAKPVLLPGRQRRSLNGTRPTLSSPGVDASSSSSPSLSASDATSSNLPVFVVTSATAREALPGTTSAAAASAAAASAASASHRNKPTHPHTAVVGPPPITPGTFDRFISPLFQSGEAASVANTTSAAPSSSVKKSSAAKAVKPSKRSAAEADLDVNDSDADSTSEFTARPGATEEERRQLALARNRQAASRCRAKKKRWLSDLEQREQSIQMHNSALVLEVEELRMEIERLRQVLLKHTDCAVTRALQASGGDTGMEVKPTIASASNRVAQIEQNAEIPTKPTVVKFALRTPAKHSQSTYKYAG